MTWYESTALTGILVGVALAAFFGALAAWAWMSFRKLGGGWKAVAASVLAFLALGSLTTIITPAGDYLDARARESSTEPSTTLAVPTAPDIDDEPPNNGDTTSTNVESGFTDSPSLQWQFDFVRNDRLWKGPNLTEAEAAYCETERGTAGVIFSGNNMRLIGFRTLDQSSLSQASIRALRNLSLYGDSGIDTQAYEAVTAEVQDIVWVEGGVEGLEGSTEVRVCKQAYKIRDEVAFPAPPGPPIPAALQQAEDEPVAPLTDAEKVWCASDSGNAAEVLAADTLNLIVFLTLHQRGLSETTKMALENVMRTGSSGLSSSATASVNAELNDIWWVTSAEQKACKAAFASR